MHDQSVSTPHFLNTAPKPPKEKQGEKDVAGCLARRIDRLLSIWSVCVSLFAVSLTGHRQRDSTVDGERVRHRTASVRLFTVHNFSLDRYPPIVRRKAAPPPRLSCLFTRRRRRRRKTVIAFNPGRPGGLAEGKRGREGQSGIKEEVESRKCAIRNHKGIAVGLLGSAI